MKRIITVVLSICIVLCATSCGGEDISKIERKTEQTTVNTSSAATPVSTAKQTTTANSAATDSVVTAEAAKIGKTDTSSKLYYIPKDAAIYDKEKNKVGTIAAGSLYSGHYDPQYEGFVVIKHRYSERLIEQSSVKVQTGAVILETAAIGQMGGDIYGKKACGPTSATILVKYQLGKKWTKDELIVFCEKNNLNDQGSLRSGGGITAPKLIELIESYSGATIKASNVYGDDSASILKKLIDSGNRSIVVASYKAGKIVAQKDSPAHFVVICGYEYVGDTLYFYYADPYFGNGGRSLMRVSAQTLAESMKYVTKEPRCIITVEAE